MRISAPGDGPQNWSVGATVLFMAGQREFPFVPSVKLRIWSAVNDHIGIERETRTRLEAWVGPVMAHYTKRPVQNRLESRKNEF